MPQDTEDETRDPSPETPEDRLARAKTRAKLAKQAAQDRANAMTEYTALGEARRAKSAKLKKLRLLKEANSRAAAKLLSKKPK